MGFFSFFSKNDSVKDDAQKEADLELFAPVSGEMIPISDVPDLVISEKLIGDGIGIIPDDSEILAPCSGMISRLTATNNAFAIKTELGVEIYVTFGIGNHRFKGEGLTPKVNLGTQVNRGDPVISIDFNKVSEHLESTVTSMIVVNSSARIARVISITGKALAGKTACTWVILKDPEESDSGEVQKSSSDK